MNKTFLFLTLWLIFAHFEFLDFFLLCLVFWIFMVMVVVMVVVEEFAYKYSYFRTEGQWIADGMGKIQLKY